MTANRRILLNIVATYGRSLYALVIGLFCGRWTLMALGQVDYGLVGLVGGLAGFISFLNGILASAVGRFYAVSVGAARKAENAETGLEECRKWFNAALSVHSVLPAILIIVGYPIGIWAVENFLTIPVERIPACIWVWRFTCLSCFVGMANVPFQAMYTAKQEIAELTIYSFITTTLNAIFLYYIVTHPNIWIVRYSAWTCALSVAPQLIISVRAIVKYPECRLNISYMWCKPYIVNLTKYAIASFMAQFSGLFACQIRSVVINKYLGPKMNASMSVGTIVASHALTLCGAMSGAMWPAIANGAGEDDIGRVKKMVFIVCRTGEALIMIFAIPLFLEMHEIFRIWLVNPPPFAAEISMAILLDSWLNKLTDGYWMAFSGLGIGFSSYCNRICFCGFITLAVTWVLVAVGMGAWGVCIGIVCSGIVSIIVRLHCARRYLGYSIVYWMQNVMTPALICLIVACFAGCLPRFLMEPSFLRIGLTTVMCEVVMLPTIWFVLLEQCEREFIVRHLCAKFLRTQEG